MLLPCSAVRRNTLDGNDYDDGNLKCSIWSDDLFCVIYTYALKIRLWVELHELSGNHELINQNGCKKKSSCYITKIRLIEENVFEKYHNLGLDLLVTPIVTLER